MQPTMDIIFCHWRAGIASLVVDEKKDKASARFSLVGGQCFLFPSVCHLSSYRRGSGTVRGRVTKGKLAHPDSPVNYHHFTGQPRPRHWVCKPAYLVPVPSQDKLRGLWQEGHLV